MKNIFFLLFLLCASKFALAQTFEGQAEYNKINQPALIAEYKYPDETVEKTLTDKLERMGLKVKSSKGFLVVYNSVISSIDNAAMDYAFKVERKSKHEKDVTTVSMVMNVNNANVTSANSANGKVFLSDLGVSAEAMNDDNMVTEQNDIVKKAEKKSKKLEDEKSDLEKKIERLKDDLSKNAKEIADQKMEVERQQEILDARKAKAKKTK